MKIYSSRRTEQGTLIELCSGYEFKHTEVTEQASDMFLYSCYMLMYTFSDGQRDITAYPMTNAGLSKAVEDFWFL